MKRTFNPSEWSVEDSQPVQKKPQEGLLGKIGRNAERIIPEIAGHAYGAPGDIAQLAQTAGNFLINKLTGKENALPGFGLPTSENLVQGMRQRQQQIPGYEGEYLQPQSNLEGTLSEIGKLAGGALGGGALGEAAGLGGLGKEALKATSKIGAGHAAGDYLGRSLGIDESSLPFFRFAGAFGPAISKSLYGIVSPGKLKKTASDLYEYARNNAPEQPFKATPLRTIYSELDDMRRSTHTDSSLKKFINKDLMPKLAEAAYNDKIDPRELLKLKEGLSDTYKSISGYKDAPLRREWYKVDKAVKDVFKQNAKQAPDFVNAVLDGSEMFKAGYDSLSAYNILRHKLGLSGTTLASYPAMKLFGSLGIKSIPAVATAAEAANLAKNIVKYPAMRKYYRSMMEGALENKPGLVVSSFKNLNSLIKKEMPNNRRTLKSSEWTVEE
jgi:hypothetical protein